MSFLASANSELFYADTRNVVENGELIDRWCDPGDAKVNYLLNNTGTGVLTQHASLVVMYTTPPNDPELWRSPDTVNPLHDNFVCDPY